MSIRLALILIFFVLIMLKTTFRDIKLYEPDYNRRETLIKTLTNAEKIAKMRERSKFSVNCRRENVITNFINRKMATYSDIFPDNRQVETIVSNFQKKLLNEAIKTTFRTVSFLQREQQRLTKSRHLERHPLTQFIEQRATMIYIETVQQSSHTLQKKLEDLLVSQGRTDDTFAHEPAVSSVNEGQRGTKSGRTSSKTEPNSHSAPTFTKNSDLQMKPMKNTSRIDASCDADYDTLHHRNDSAQERRDNDDSAGSSTAPKVSSYPFKDAELHRQTSFNQPSDENVDGDTAEELWFDAIQCHGNSECCCVSLVHRHSDRDAASTEQQLPQLYCTDVDMWYDASLCTCCETVTPRCTERNSVGKQCTVSTDVDKIDSSPSEDKFCASGEQNKVLNLTGDDLPDTLLRILSKGPNFALTRKISKKVLYDVEKGIERGAFALRWKTHILSKQKGAIQSLQ